MNINESEYIDMNLWLSSGQCRVEQQKVQTIYEQDKQANVDKNVRI